MIPLELKLKDFFSYQNATIDFRGLHTACICGPNGAGKSSLLEAMTWAIWGESRVDTEDEVINIDAKEVKVTFTFISNQQTYRVIRSRQRGQSTILEWQIQTGSGFVALTGKGVRVTQQQIEETIRLDYDTFINSAYLRQGKADEFMLRKPSERKEILAKLLKLDQYEQLADQAKGVAREIQGQISQIQQKLEMISLSLQQRERYSQEVDRIRAVIAQLEQKQSEQKQQLQVFQANRQKQLLLTQEKRSLENHCQSLRQQYQHLSSELTYKRSESQKLQELVDQQFQIRRQYQEFLNLQAQDQALAKQAQQIDELHKNRQRINDEWNRELSRIHGEIHGCRNQLDQIDREELEIQETLKGRAAVAEDLLKLHQLRQRIKELDELQLVILPLKESRDRLRQEIDRARTKIQTQLEELRIKENHLRQAITNGEVKRQEFLEISSQIIALEKKQTYWQRLVDKITDQQNKILRWEQEAKNHQHRIQELEDKISALGGSVCPLCERQLNDHDHQRVIQKTRQEEERLRDHLWHIQEQEAIARRDLQTIQGEIQQLQSQLQEYESLIGRRGKLTAQLEALEDSYTQMQEVKDQIALLERSLSEHSYAPEQQQELARLDARLQAIQYDETKHALIRGEESKLRIAEIRHHKIEQALRRQRENQQKKPELLNKIQTWQALLGDCESADHPLYRQLQELDEQIHRLGYDRARHNQISQTCQQMSIWVSRHDKLQDSIQELPRVYDRIAQLEQDLAATLAQEHETAQRIEQINQDLAQAPDISSQIQQLEISIKNYDQQIKQQAADLGGWQQQINQLDAIATEYQQKQQELARLQQEQKVHEELAKAFGKNGIQLMIIENVLPQLELQANQILARLSASQLNLQIITQKAGKAKKNSKMIDTLDIVISDTKGRRPYETYSGGEAFRINFAIRLALARILAQRAGTALQMLIVDEGFGTQDAEGCDHLIAAINAIAADFACILTITHMPQFKEAFQTRIEVYKTANGSQVVFSA